MLSQRIQPLLPTVEEASQKPETVYSDHLPIMAEIPFKGSPEPFKIITWNVYNPGNSWGFAPANVSSYTPSEQESKEREGRNINAVLTFIKKQSPDAMVFQEIGDLSFSPLRLQDELRSLGWKVDAGEGSVVTIYNANQFDKVILPEQNAQFSDWEVIGHLKTGLVLKNSQNEPGKADIIINNLYLHHSLSLQRAEAFILNLLESDNARFNAQSVIAGDFDKPYVPMSAVEGENLVTVATPAYLLSRGVQGANWTDGVFYQDPIEKKCHQSQVIEILDPSTGEIYKRNKLDITQRDEKNYDKIKELSQQRPFLSCAAEPEAKDDKFIRLKSELQKQKIFLFKTSNAINEKSYVISMEDYETFAVFKDFLKKYFQKEIEPTSQFDNYLHLDFIIPKNQFSEYQEALETYLSLTVSKRRLYIEANIPIEAIENIDELSAENKWNGFHIYKVIERAMENYKLASERRSTINSMFLHGKSGMLRANELHQSVLKNVETGALENNLQSLADHLSKPKVALREDSFTTFLLLEIVKAKQLNKLFHLEEFDIKQLHVRNNQEQEKRKEEKMKVGASVKEYNLNKKEDRKELKNLILERVQVSLEIQKMHKPITFVKPII